MQLYSITIGLSPTSYCTVDTSPCYCYQGIWFDDTNILMFSCVWWLCMAIHIIISVFSMPCCTPAAFPAGVDPKRGSEETVRSPGVL